MTSRKNSLFSENYLHVYENSIQNPEKFWGELSNLVDWFKPWNKVMDNSNEPFTKWFVGGKLNACYNAVDRHVENGKGGKVALIYDSPMLGVNREITYFELQNKVAKLAGALAKIGVQKGDTVIIYMPLIPETVMAMLAVARLGAVHSVVFGGFAAAELCTRIEHAEPKVIITASSGIEPNKIINYMGILDEALSLCKHQPLKCIVKQRHLLQEVSLDSSRDLDWEEALNYGPSHACVPVESNDPLYILYTSGTTGDPKGVQRPTAGHLVTLTWTMRILYGMYPNDVWWSTSDFGWVVGHSYMCYAPLLCGMTSIIYEGKPTTTPNPGEYYRIINDYKVNGLFTVPTAMRLLKQADSDGEFIGEYDLSSLRRIWFAGEHCDLTTKQWAEKTFEVPSLNHWWQTETGSAITGMCMGLDNPCSPTKLTVGLPFPGYQIEVLKKDGSRAEVNELGRIAIKLPLPPGTLTTLYKAPHKFVATYFTEYPGYYDTMDAGYIDEDGLIYVTARADDIISVAGHRLSTLAVENVVLSHPDVCDACVISVPDEIKNEVPFCLFVLKNGSNVDEFYVREELIGMVREIIGPVACFKLCAAVNKLPVTRSGKICRKSLSDLARNNLKKIPSTVVDPAVYDDVKAIFIKMGYCKN